MNMIAKCSQSVALQYISYPLLCPLEETDRTTTEQISTLVDDSQQSINTVCGAGMFVSDTAMLQGLFNTTESLITDQQSTVLTTIKALEDE